MADQADTLRRLMREREEGRGADAGVSELTISSTENEKFSQDVPEKESLLDLYVGRFTEEPREGRA